MVMNNIFVHTSTRKERKKNVYIQFNHFSILQCEETLKQILTDLYNNLKQAKINELL